ncbi:MAG: DUF2095 family protein [Candidatus Bathyarchaeia archaeon]|nr:DUF2095 family protein [Candidatus Bathyarchaeia archaeon]
MGFPYIKLGYASAVEGAIVEFDKETFKKLFPNLAKELDSNEHKVAINSVRTDVQSGEKASAERFAHYMPDVIDFIRRCDTEEQAKEIIDFMEKRGEIERQYAKKLRRQLREKGVRSFGPKKEENYYFKHGEQG